MVLYDIRKDDVFKRVFGSEDAESKDSLKGFLSLHLNKQIEDIFHHNIELKDDYIQEKDTFFDFFCILSSGERVNVEMQLENDPHNLKRRSGYYLAKNVTTQNLKGKDYSCLVPCIHILICDFVLYPDTENDVHDFMMRSIKGRVFDDLERMIIVELPKVDQRNWDEESAKMMNHKEAWNYYFRHCAEVEKQDIIKVLTGRYGDIQMADKRRMELSATEMEALQQMYEEKAQLEEERILRKWKEQGLKEGREKGREEGRKEGREEGRNEGHAEGLVEGEVEGQIKMAVNMINNLMEATNLSVNDAMDMLKVPKNLKDIVEEKIAKNR